MSAARADMADAIERWAFARGLSFGDSPLKTQPWQVSLDGPRTEVTIWRHNVDEPDHWTVTPEVALTWALVVEANVPPMDIGPCLACAKRGGPHEWGVASARRYSGPLVVQASLRGARDWNPDQANTVVWRNAVFSEHGARVPEAEVVVGSRLCRVCGGSGRATIEAPRLVLEAAPELECGRPMLEHAAVLADQLQAQGHPAGLALALMLGPWREAEIVDTDVVLAELDAAWRRSTVECRSCNGPPVAACVECHGFGRAVAESNMVQCDRCGGAGFLDPEQRLMFEHDTGRIEVTVKPGQRLPPWVRPSAADEHRFDRDEQGRWVLRPDRRSCPSCDGGGRYPAETVVQHAVPFARDTPVAMYKRLMELDNRFVRRFMAYPTAARIPSIDLCAMRVAFLGDPMASSVLERASETVGWLRNAEGVADGPWVLTDGSRELIAHP